MVSSQSPESSNIDDGDFDPQELYQLSQEALAAAGWNDPSMDVYDNYDENYRKIFHANPTSNM